MQAERDEQFYLISPYDGSKWLDDEVARETPIPRVRQFLGGRWDRSSQYHESIKAYFNGTRKVLVMKFPEGTTQEMAHTILGTIREGREDLS